MVFKILFQECHLNGIHFGSRSGSTKQSFGSLNNITSLKAILISKIPATSLMNFTYFFLLTRLKCLMLQSAFFRKFYMLFLLSADFFQNQKMFSK